MPWLPSDAQAKDSKANTPKKRRRWSDIANDVLRRTGSDERAVRTANGILKKAAERAEK